MRAFDYHIQQSSIMFIKAKSYIHMQSLKTEIEEKTKTKKQKHNRKRLQKQKTNRLRVPKTSLHYTTQTKTEPNDIPKTFFFKKKKKNLRDRHSPS
jgi:ribosomal protein L18